MSWLEEQEHILSIDSVPYREPIQILKCYFFYINMNDYIDRINIEELEIDGSGVLASDKILHIIQSKKVYTNNTKFVFQDLFLFHIDLEPDEIQGFISDDGGDSEGAGAGSRFFRKISVTDNVIVPPSIRVFHNINSLYFFFHETLLYKKREPKSILKMGGGGLGKHTKRKIGNVGSHTRKVAWK